MINKKAVTATQISEFRKKDISPVVLGISTENLLTLLRQKIEVWYGPPSPEITDLGFPIRICRQCDMPEPAISLESLLTHISLHEREEALLAPQQTREGLNDV